LTPKFAWRRTLHTLGRCAAKDKQLIEITYVFRKDVLELVKQESLDVLKNRKRENVGRRNLQLS